MAVNDDGKTELHRAVEDADVERVRRLILHGADVNARDSKGRTPMPRHPSILENLPQQREILKMLVDAGADLTSCDLNELYGFDLQICDVLRYGTRELVRIIIQSNMDLSANYEGWSALHYLANNKNPGVVEELRKKVVVLNMCDEFHSLPICRAIYASNPEMVEYFFKNGFESRNLNSTFLINASIGDITEETVEVLEILLQYKIDPFSDFSHVVMMHRHKAGAPKMKPWPVIKQVVANYVIQEYFEKLNVKVSNLISSAMDIQHYYEWCKKQLEEMKNSRIYEKLTYFQLLIANEDKLESLASSNELVFRLKNMTKFPRWNKFYGRIIQKRIAMILKITELRKYWALKICTIFGQLYNWNYLISSKIASFFNYEDLERLFLLDDDE